MLANRSEQNTALLLTVLLHAGFLALVWLSAQFVASRPALAAAGKPVMATLLVSSADVARAQAVMAAAAKQEQPPKPEQALPQPVPEPTPQTSDADLQLTPQEQLDKPDTEDQEAISRLAQEQARQIELEEQEERRRQDQVDLTADIERTQEAERRQRLREQIEEIRLKRDAAAKQTRMEADRLQQLADRSAAPEPRPGPAPASPRAGNNGDDNGLRSRYIAAVNATARANWNTLQSPKLVRCQVRFFQYHGGNVYKVEFLSCPYDPEARDAVERALMKTSMPFIGFESVFSKEFTLTFCYPDEACQL